MGLGADRGPECECLCLCGHLWLHKGMQRVPTLGRAGVHQNQCSDRPGPCMFVPEGMILGQLGGIRGLRKCGNGLRSYSASGLPPGCCVCSQETSCEHSQEAGRVRALDRGGVGSVSVCVCE